MAEGEFWKGYELLTPISDELRAELVARSKDTMIIRLDKEAANKAHRESILGAESDESEEDDDDIVEVPYDKWKNSELIEEINERNTARVEAGLEPLSTEGKKADLVAVLEKDDEESEEDEPSNG
jgi:hypothetical protein